MAQSQVIFCCVVLALAFSLESVAANKGKGFPMIASETKCVDKCSDKCEPVSTEVCKDVPKAITECKDVPSKETTKKCKTVCETVTTTDDGMGKGKGGAMVMMMPAKGKGMVMPMMPKGKGRKLQHLKPLMFGKGKGMMGGKSAGAETSCKDVCKDETVEVIKKECKTVTKMDTVCKTMTSMDCKKVCTPKCMTVPVLVKPMMTKTVVLPVFSKGKGL